MDNHGNRTANAARVFSQALVGALAGTAAGPLIVGLVGTLASTPAIVTQNDPISAFLAGLVMLTLFVGIPVGAPIGAVVGLIAGGIRGWRSGQGAGRTTAQTGDLVNSPTSWGGCALALVAVLAVPGAILLVLLINGYRDSAQFARFSAEVERLGGRARDADFEGFSFTVESIEVDLSSTATDDDALARLVRDPMFERVHSLSLAGTRVTDRGLAALGERASLHHLDLSHTLITDRGLASMSRCCPSTLKLSGTPITDATLRLFEQQAERYPNRHIDLTDTRVTEERVREFGESHTMMTIDYGPSQTPKHTR